MGDEDRTRGQLSQEMKKFAWSYTKFRKNKETPFNQDRYGIGKHFFFFGLKFFEMPMAMILFRIHLNAIFFLVLTVKAHL